MRILGNGVTAQSVKEHYKNALFFDDTNVDEYEINSNELTLVSPGIPPHNYLVKNTKNIISDCDLFLSNIDKFLKCEFSIWVSGTNGKTTTTQMCELLLKDKNFIACGNIGFPLAKAVSITESNNSTVNLILEISSYTLHYTSKVKPNIYLLLPISDDHITWHGSFENYEKSKLKPLSLMNKNDIAIIPSKYQNIKSFANIITYDNSYDLAKKFDIDIGKINFKEPFLFDAILALSASKIINEEINYEKINSFKTDVHKMEEFYYKNNVLFVNDSKGTNVDATVQALKTYKNNYIHIILGGDDKGVNLNPLFEELKKHNIKIYTIGSNANKLNELSKQYSLKYFNCYDMLNAVNKIKTQLEYKANTVVLLSPATSSFDQFDSYKQRGEIFKNIFLNNQY